MSAAESPRSPRPWTGAKASAAVQRWPRRNYFAELEPRSKTVHPIDALIDHHPAVQRIRRRARRLLTRIQKQSKPDDLLDFEAERNLLDATRVEVAFNLGFENGLLLGRTEGLKRSAHRARDRHELALVRDLQATLAGTKASPRAAEAVLLELAWALNLGGGSRR